MHVYIPEIEHQVHFRKNVIFDTLLFSRNLKYVWYEGWRQLEWHRTWRE